MNLFIPIFRAAFTSALLLHAETSPSDKGNAPFASTKSAFCGLVGLALCLVLPQCSQAIARPVSGKMLFTVSYGDVPLSCDLRTGLFLPAASVPLDGEAITEAESGTITLTVRIEGIKALRGVVRVALFDKEKGFPNGKDAAIQTKTTDAKAETASVTFVDLPPGRYAVAVQHDQNNDGRLNRNTLGIPKERYGFSNNVRGTFGPPSFRAAAFALDANRTMTIKVK